MSSKKKLLLGLFLVIVASLSVYIFKLSRPNIKVTNFDECVSAGYKLSETYIYPPQCKTPGGKIFIQATPTSEQPGIANPASVYCRDQGGILQIRKDNDGNEAGFCIFSDGSECEEWAYFHHECGPSVSPEEGFCGSSTYGKCAIEADCKSGGCSGQICQSKDEEGAITTCEWKDCYDSKRYELECQCINQQCQWQ